MRDLNLGPDSKRLIERYNRIDKLQTSDKLDMIAVAGAMAKMLERWIDVAWCWPDACPATICGGPHVKVKYEFNRGTEVIEPVNKVGETFPDAKYIIIT